jgi:integrase
VAVPAAPTTLKAALTHYETKSADFAVLADETKALYRVSLGELADDFGHLPVTTFTAGYILKLRDAWALRGHRAANVRLQVLKNVLWPSIVERDDGDPFALIPAVKRPRTLAEPHPIWPEAVVTTVIEAAIGARKFGLGRGVAFGRYAGARRGDIVRVTSAARIGGYPINQPRRLIFLSGKKRVRVDMPEDPMLTRWLDETPAIQPFTRDQRQRRRRAGVVQLPTKAIVFNTKSQRYTEDGFGQELAKLVRALYLAGKIDADHYDAHGLRHSFGVELALAGCSDAEGAALMGHGSPASFAIYRRQANRIALADGGAEKLRRLREQSGSAMLEKELEKSCKTAQPDAASIDVKTLTP